MERLRIAAIDHGGSLIRKPEMRMKSISLATAFALASTAALAQGGAVGGSPQGGPSAPGQGMKNPATGGGAMQNNTTTGSTRPSPNDASTQGAGTAGSAEKRGDDTSPGGTMRK